MPDYDTLGPVNLIPEKKIAITFTHSVESSDGAGDGTLTYGSAVSSVDVKVYNGDFTEDVTSDIMDGTAQLIINDVTVVFKYPTTNGPGRYKALITLTINNGTDVLPLRFYRIFSYSLDSN